MAKIGYVRVSTADQNTDRQEVALQERGVERIFLEKVSGKNTDRLELKKMIEYVREGDILYIESISRLARSTRDLLNIVQNLTEKGALPPKTSPKNQVSLSNTNYRLRCWRLVSKGTMWSYRVILQNPTFR